MLENEVGQFYLQKCWLVLNTTPPPKFNMEPENDGFQKESLFPGADFQMFKLQGCSVFFEGGEVILINKMFAYKGTIMWDLVGVCFGRGGCGGNYILTPPPQK